MTAKRWVDVFDYISHTHSRIIIDINSHMQTRRADVHSIQLHLNKHTQMWNPFIFQQSKEITMAINFYIDVKSVCRDMLMEHNTKWGTTTQHASTLLDKL